MTAASPSSPFSGQPLALVVAGGGRYADPWHPFEVTSGRLAAVLRGEGVAVEVADDVDAALAVLVDEARWPDLLVVDVGCPRDGVPSPAPGAARDGLASFLAGDRPLLAVHVSATSFAETPEWEQRLGGRWVPDRSWHPDLGPASVRVRRGASPLVADLDDVEVVDERYCDLRTAGDITVLADHEHDGRTHPLVWLHEAGGVRTAYDALGHDERSYDSAGHRLLLQRLVGWLLTPHEGGAS